MGTIPRPKGFHIEGKKHMKELKNKFDMGFNEINHKIDMKVKKDYQVIISPLLQSMLGFRQAIFPGGVCFRFGSRPQERIKFSVRVLSLGGTENGGRCPSTVIENRTGGRKRRRNDHPSVWSDTVLSPVTTTISDRGNRYKGRHGFYCAIRKRTSGGDTSL